MVNVVCVVDVQDRQASFTWQEGSASFLPYQLHGPRLTNFKDLAQKARRKLDHLVQDYHAGQDIGPAARELATLGYSLYQQVFQPGADQRDQANRIRQWLEDLRDQGDVDSLEFVVAQKREKWDIPWNVIYDQPVAQQSFEDASGSNEAWQPFWGLRYNLAGGCRADPLRRMPTMVDPKVLLVIDPRIRNRLPAKDQQRLQGFIESHEVTVAGSQVELAEAVRTDRPEVLYWLSHADPEGLELGYDRITPQDLMMIFDNAPTEYGGLVFLNACQTAEGEKSFFSVLDDVGFSGMVGTEARTIDTFAAPFGLDFLEAFLDRGRPIGEILRELRGRIPLGLLYGTYCPPHIRVAPRGPAKPAGVNIQRERGAGGTLLSTAVVDAAITLPLPAEPYPSLAYYERKDRPLFAGRDKDVPLFAMLLDAPDTRIVILHGESGVGKSSFLRAGVLPYLEDECLGYRFVHDRSDSAGDRQQALLFVRTTNDLFGQLAGALCNYCQRPFDYETPAGETVEVDLPSLLARHTGGDASPGSVREALSKDVSLLGRILSDIDAQLPFSPVLVIDQCEEMFTLSRSDADIANRRHALDMLRHLLNTTGGYKIVLATRTEYFGRLVDRLRRGLKDRGGVREYLLTDFDEGDLAEAIKRPTSREPVPYSHEIPYEKYHFEYEEGFAERLAAEVITYGTSRRDSVFPLMQVICAQLYQLVRNREDQTIRAADLEAIGGMHGGIRRHVETMADVLTNKKATDKRAFMHLMTRLYLRQPDGGLTTALVRQDEVSRYWQDPYAIESASRLPFETMLAGAVRLRLLRVNSLRIGGHQEQLYVSLGHDALAKVAAEWDEELTRWARVRKMAMAVAAISTVAVLMALLAIWANQARRMAVQAEKKAVAAEILATDSVRLHLTPYLDLCKLAGECVEASIHAAQPDAKSLIQEKLNELKRRSEDPVRYGKKIVDAMKQLGTALEERRSADSLPGFVDMRVGSASLALVKASVETWRECNDLKGYLRRDANGTWWIGRLVRPLKVPPYFEEEIIADPAPELDRKLASKDFQKHVMRDATLDRLCNAAIFATRDIANAKNLEQASQYFPDFERLYWAELYWVELDQTETNYSRMKNGSTPKKMVVNELERAMVLFRRQLEQDIKAGRDSPSEALATCASDVKTACDNLLAEHKANSQVSWRGPSASTP